MRKSEAALNSAVILSYEYWQKQYGADPGVIGQRIDATDSPIIGVMPPGAINLQIGWAHLWRPLRMRQELDRTQTTDARYVRVVGRLRPGVSREQALAQMNVVQRQLQNERPELFAGYDVRITSLRDMMTGEFRPALLILMGTVGCLLLLACASLANLLIARSGAQEREMAVRIALGASRMNVLGLTLGHGFRLALTGIGIGLVMSLALARLISFLLYGLPAFDLVTFVLAPTVLLLVTLSAAFLPAFRAIRINPVEALRSE